MSFTNSPKQDQKRGIRTFHARQGRISPLTAKTITSHQGSFILDPQAPFDPIATFGATPVIFDIGCGFGEATTAMAAAQPQIAIVAFDVHVRGIARLLQEVDHGNLTNVRALNTDAVSYLNHMVPNDCLDGVRIYFPDPWPKARHNKRRLIQPDFVRLLVSAMKSGATLHCATDWQPYAEHMLKVLTNCSELTNTVQDFAPRPQWRPVTRYESAGIAKGHKIFDLIFRRT